MDKSKTDVQLARVAMIPDSMTNKHGDPYEIVINRGTEHGVKIGDQFLVFGYGPDVIDPETNESLGRIEIVRGRGSVIHVQDKIATLKSIEKKKSQPTKRVVRRNDRWAAIAGLGETIEETVPDERDLPFDGAAIGDYVRAI